ncbi:MAG: hypothetical protein AAGJ93_05880, partial [Bacteroidota bacterium]
NRTFDFRKRRIFELQQLQSVFQEENIPVADDFSLFAVINDNWAFARRATLPNGKRWRYGLGGEVSLLFQRTLTPFSDFYSVQLNPYIERTSAFIRNNNSSHLISGRLSAVLRDISYSGSSFLLDEEYGYGGRIDLTYEFIWLPISRTSLRCRTTLGGDLREVKRAFIPQKELETTYSLASNLTYDYFISPQWSLQLSAGLIIGDDGFTPGDFVRPMFNISSQYFVF